MSEKIAKIGIVTASDRASAGIYEDLSGKAIIDTINSYLTSSWEPVYRCIEDDKTTIKNTLKDFKEYLECDKMAVEPCPELGNVMVLFDKDKQAKKREREINVVSASGKIIYGNVLIVSSLLDSAGNSESLTKEEIKNILIKIKSK